MSEANAIVFTPDQQAAYDDFTRFILDPAQHIWVLAGYAGTGKTTFVAETLRRLPKVESTVKLIDPEFKGWQIRLTATTNKACEALKDLSDNQYNVTTVHSLLNLYVHRNYETGATELKRRKIATILSGMVIFIDEASYLDQETLKHLFELTRSCKIVFMGDPAQLTAINCRHSPVFAAGYPTSSLTQVVRQTEGNPIIDLATAFRETVNTGHWHSFRPDGKHIIHLADRRTWGATIRAEFTRSDWGHKDSKVLAWRNKTVIDYNQAIHDWVKGNPNFRVGDYGIVNTFMPGVYTLRTDQAVRVSGIVAECHQHGILGTMLVVDDQREVFLPRSLEDRKSRYKLARDEEDYATQQDIDENWIDLRAAYACTINKSQGSTYDRVFIDLDDIKACNNGNTIARMMYVAVSRARHQVIFTGDLV